VTDVSTVPSDWELRAVESLGSIRGGKRLPKGRSLTELPTPHPYIRVTDMRPGWVDTSNVRYVPDEVAPLIRAYRIFRGDIFISVAGTLGIVGRIPNELSGANLTENADRITSIDCDADYLMYSLLSGPIQREIEAIRTVGAQPKLALGRIKRFRVLIPKSRTEQSRVAGVLRDVDQHIAVLERLICKKQAIKEGMAQRLLTGKTRLPNFKGHWPEVALGTHATGLRGAGLSKALLNPSGRYPCVLYGELFTTYGRRIEDVRSRTNTDSGVRSQAGDVLIPGSTTTVARDLATASALHSQGVLLGGDTNIVRSDKEIDPDWLAYYVTDRLGDRIAEIAQGTTIKHLYVRDLLKCRIVLPSLSEQRAIVAALLDAEADVSTLRRRLGKAREMKQGMMQELLTGHIRLPVTEETA